MNDFAKQIPEATMEMVEQPRVIKTRKWRIGSISSWPTLARSALLLVGLPTLFATVYFGFVASDIYISETRYAIRTSDGTSSTDLLSGLISSGGMSSSNDDSQIVSDYILSRDMLTELEDRLGLRGHYGSQNVDWVSRLPVDASEEDFLDYYRNMVEINIDSSSDISVLRVSAFDPITAQRITKTITELSERLINRWSERITEDTLRFARKELSIAENAVRRTSSAVTQFRNESGSVDPGEETSAVLGIVMDLEAKLASAKAELIEAQSYLRSDSAQIKTLKSRISALQAQIRDERTRLTGTSDADLTRLISGYEPLILDQKLAEQRYASALTSLELARAQAQKQQRYLIPFVTPELPDEALEPERLWNILTVFAGSLLIFGIGTLIWAAINEHIGV